jgi:cyclase
MRSRLEAVGPGVYAYVQEPGGWCLSNAGVIAGGDGVVVVDTLATQPRAQELRRVVDRLAPGPRRTVVNTHHHGDHTFGNQVFGPAAAIVAHHRLPGELAEAGLGLTRLWPDVEWGALRLVPPTITFADTLTLTVGDRPVELIHVGPAHTTNDVVVWLPDSRVLFAGDAVLSGCTPFVLMGSVSGSLAAIERLRALEPETVVCGHGPVTGPEVFEVNAAYLRRIQQVAAEAHATGLKPLDAAFEAGPGELADLLDPERLVGNLHRAYAELAGAPPGAPLDVLGIFAEMVDYNGGEVPTCLA